MKSVPSGFLPVALKTNRPVGPGAVAVPCRPCDLTVYATGPVPVHGLDRVSVFGDPAQANSCAWAPHAGVAPALAGTARAIVAVTRTASLRVPLMCANLRSKSYERQRTLRRSAPTGRKSSGPGTSRPGDRAERVSAPRPGGSCTSRRIALRHFG